MPTTYLGRTILTPEEYAEEQVAGWSNPNSNYENYLAMIREQTAQAEKAGAEAAELGFELKGPELDLSPEMDAVLDQVWAELAARKKTVEFITQAA